MPTFDNFYLDFNGIIHEASHPKDEEADVHKKPRSFDEIMTAIFSYVENIIKIVQPRQLLFLAVDGCAPRAKMNQQRARRFRSAQDQRERRMVGDVFDSNCITPGTDFMAKLSEQLRWFIAKKIKEDSLWSRFRVIFSGHDVPGEGEHKIMQFVREEKLSPSYDENKSHLMYGQDSDLIMLGLAAHEKNFTLFREVIIFGRRPRERSQETQFTLLHLNSVKVSLAKEFRINIADTAMVDRVIDDFVLLTFLCGNDFMPHLPSLYIGDKAFDVLFDAYKRVCLDSSPPHFLVENGEICDFSTLESLCGLVGTKEEDILRRRENRSGHSHGHGKADPLVPTPHEIARMEMELAQGYEDAMEEDAMGFGSMPRPHTEVKHADKDYRGRHYFDKFMVLVRARSGAIRRQADQLLADLTAKYLEGLVWCLAYYMKGCVSWSWFFPFHYGPMLQDLRDLDSVGRAIVFSLDAPFRPFQQLLGCLPPASAALLPRSYQSLMISESSPVKKFYPDDFAIDMDGKVNVWEAVVLLDFIDASQLREAEARLCDPAELTEAERKRNQFGVVCLFFADPSTQDDFPSCGSLPAIPQCGSRLIEIPWVAGQTTLHGFDEAALPPLSRFEGRIEFPTAAAARVKLPCKFFTSASGCQRGAQCTFLHPDSGVEVAIDEGSDIVIVDETELPSLYKFADRQTLSTPTTKARSLCKFFASASGCQRGAQCTFLHPADDCGVPAVEEESDIVICPPHRARSVLESAVSIKTITRCKVTVSAEALSGGGEAVVHFSGGSKVAMAKELVRGIIEHGPSFLESEAADQIIRRKTFSKLLKSSAESELAAARHAIHDSRTTEQYSPSWQVSAPVDPAPVPPAPVPSPVPSVARREEQKQGGVGVERMCAACFRPTPTKRCSACKAACYCNAQCQQSHWAVHESECKQRK